MNKPIVGAIDGDKLLEWLYEPPADDFIIHEIESGRFAIPSDQGEATRLREVLEEVRRLLDWPMPSAEAHVKKLIDQALSSSHREDGIQKVRELLDHPMAAGAYRVGVIDGLRAVGFPIPGITEER